ncbi:hypothetical protein BDN71DRAFT_1429132 [Pleurotus eryngii]|uniref:Uncharacterized protein n=1 Tax=Pleurotus eryngii TaxID=5323 RepID=A0A9P6A2R4_PLEER|nr:hypothetical protein BDN71DRAFT_1429132 [Pleurotus eryngii]
MQSQVAQADLEDQPAHTINTRVSNKTAHPGQIIHNNMQKHHSPAEVQAVNNAKKADKLIKKLIDEQAHHDALDKIAEEEERLFLEDLARHCVAERPDMDLSKHAVKASKLKKITSRVVDVSDGEEGGASMSEGLSLPDINTPEFTWDDVEVEAASSTVVNILDTDSQDCKYKPARDEEQSNCEDMDVNVIPQKKTSSTSKGKAALKATSGKKTDGEWNDDETTDMGCKWVVPRAPPKPLQEILHRPSVPPFTQNYQPEPTSDIAAVATTNTPAIAGSSARSNQKVTIHDLPFPRGQCASRHLEFLPTLKQLWVEKFPELADTAEDRALIIIARATIRDHRSAIGKAAVAVVANLIPTDATTPQKGTPVSPRGLGIVPRASDLERLEGRWDSTQAPMQHVSRRNEWRTIR